MPGEQRIFFDPRDRRWRRFTRRVEIASAFLSVVFGALLAAILVNPALPVVGVPSSRALPSARHVLPAAVRGTIVGWGKLDRKATVR